MSARLGHRDVATTQRIYIHEFDAANRSDERQAKLAALYGGNAMEKTCPRRVRQTYSAETANTRTCGRRAPAGDRQRSTE